MQSCFTIILVSTVVALATSVPDVYYPQQHPEYRQPQQWSRNQPSFDSPHYSEGPARTYRQQQVYYPEQKYQPHNHQEDAHSAIASSSATAIRPRVKNIQIISGPGPMEFKLPLNGDTEKIEIARLNAETYENDVSPSNLPPILEDPSSVTSRNLKLFYYNPEEGAYRNNFSLNKQFSGPETDNKKPVNHGAMNSLKTEDRPGRDDVKIIRINANDYREGDIPEYLPLAVQEALMKARANLISNQGSGQNVMDQSGSDVEIIKKYPSKQRQYATRKNNAPKPNINQNVDIDIVESSSEPKQPETLNNNTTKPMYGPHPKYRKKIVSLTDDGSLQNYPNHKSPNKYSSQGPVDQISTSQIPKTPDLDVASREVNQASVNKLKTTPTNNNRSDLRDYNSSAPITQNRDTKPNESTIRNVSSPKYQTHSKDKKKSIVDIDKNNYMIPADGIVDNTWSSSDESKIDPKHLSQRTTEVSRKYIPSQATTPSDNDESGYDDFTEAPPTFEPSSTIDNYKSSTFTIPDDWKPSDSSHTSYNKEPIDYKRRSKPITADKTLAEDELGIQFEGISPSVTEASTKDTANQTVFLSDANKNITNDSTAEPLTLKPIPRTENYDSSIPPNNERRPFSSTPPTMKTNTNSRALSNDDILSDNGPNYESNQKKSADDNNKSEYQIPADETWTRDISNIDSKELSQRTTEVSTKYIPSEATTLSEDDKSGYDDFTETPLTIEPLSTADSYEPSASIISDDWKPSDSSRESYNKKPVAYVKNSKPDTVDNTLSDDEPGIKFEGLAPNVTEAPTKDLANQTVFLSDANKKINNSSTEVPLTLKPLPRTDNYESSTSPVIEDSEPNSLPHTSFKNKSVDNKINSKPLIPTGKTLNGDEYGARSDDISPSLTKASKDDVETHQEKEEGKHVAEEDSLNAGNFSDSDITNEDSESREDVSETREKYESHEQGSDEDSNSYSMESQETLSDYNNENNTDKTFTVATTYYFNDGSSTNDTYLEMTVNTSDESVKEGDGAENTNPDVEINHHVQDTTSADAEKVEENANSDATVILGEESENTETYSFKEMETTPTTQAYTPKTTQTEDDMTPLAFVVALVQNIYQGGDSVFKMFHDPRFRGFVAKHLPILNIQFA